MISERSANRGSCAQSCRKDYVLTDARRRARSSIAATSSRRKTSARTIISRRSRTPASAVSRSRAERSGPSTSRRSRSRYREFLDRVEQGDTHAADRRGSRSRSCRSSAADSPAACTAAARGAATSRARSPTIAASTLGTSSVGPSSGGELIVDVSSPIEVGDGLGFEAPDARRRSDGRASASPACARSRRTGATRQATRDAHQRAGGLARRAHVGGALLERARASYAALPPEIAPEEGAARRRLFGAPGTPLKAVFVSRRRSRSPCGPRSRCRVARQASARRSRRCASSSAASARRRSCSAMLDVAALSRGLFLPVSELNHLRQQAVEQLMLRRDWAPRCAALAERRARDRSARCSAIRRRPEPTPAIDTALSLSRAGLSHRGRRGRAIGRRDRESCFDPFLRHPTPPVARVRALRRRARRAAASTLRLRTPTIVRPEERKTHSEVARPRPADAQRPPRSRRRAGAGRARRRRRLRGQLLQPAHGGRAVPARRATHRRVGRADDRRAARSSSRRGTDDGFDVFLYGRPEGMTIEHCVLSAAFDREPTTCRDLCVQKHTERRAHRSRPATRFPVATDSACRNRLLHSRPIEASEFLPRLWRGGHSRLSAGVQRRRATTSRDRVAAIARRSTRSRAAARPDVDAVRASSAPSSRAATSLARSNAIARCARVDDAAARRSSHAERHDHDRAAHARRRARRAARALRLSRRFVPGRKRAVESVLAGTRHARRAAHRRRKVALLSGAGADAAQAHRRHLAAHLADEGSGRRARPRAACRRRSSTAR